MDVGFAWQVWGILLFGFAQHAFRAADAGKRASVLSYFSGFAWQVGGIKRGYLRRPALFCVASGGNCARQVNLLDFGHEGE